MLINLSYQYNQAGQKAAALAGIDAARHQTISLRGDECPKELLARILNLTDVDTDGNVSLHLNLDRRRVGAHVVRRTDRLVQHATDTEYTTSEIDAVSGYPVPEHEGGASYPLTVEEVVALEEQIRQKIEASYAAAEEELEQAQAEDQAAFQKAEAAMRVREEARLELEEAARLRRKKEQEEAAAAHKELAEEPARWVAAHGSERLKLAVEMNMLEQLWGVYLGERIAQELPGWMFDTDWLDGCVYYDDEVEQPSLDQLLALKEAKANNLLKDTRLTTATTNTPEIEPPLPPEVVLIASYQDRLVVKRFS